jgi:hypothetical protein
LDQAWRQQGIAAFINAFDEALALATAYVAENNKSKECHRP